MRIVDGGEKEKKTAAESSTSPGEKHGPASASVSVSLVLCSLWSIFAVCRMTYECCTSSRMCGIHQPVLPVCVCS